MLQDKIIAIKLEQADGSWIETINEVKNINSSVDNFHDFLIRMIDSAKYSRIVCVLKDETKSK